MFKNFFLTSLIFIFFITNSHSERIEKIDITGNERISKDTISRLITNKQSDLDSVRNINGSI